MLPLGLPQPPARNPVGLPFSSFDRCPVAAAVVSPLLSSVRILSVIEVSSVNGDSVEQTLLLLMLMAPPLSIRAVLSFSSAARVGSLFFALLIFLICVLNISLVSQGRVGFIFATIPVRVPYGVVPPLLAFAVSTFLATMLSAILQV